MRRFASSLALAAALGACSSGVEGTDTVGDEGALTLPAPGCDASRRANNPNFEFQDDVCKRKAWPSNADRAWACPNRAAAIPSSFQPARPLGDVTFDTTTFADVPSELDLTVIAIRRDPTGAPHYRYFSNGTHDRAFQPLSATKFMAVANAARKMREQSNGHVGLDATVSGIPLGDLVTIIHNYNEQHYESNALARYFENVGGRDNAQSLVHHWLGRPADESFGGNYGAAAPGLSYDFVTAAGATVQISPDDPPHAPANHLSTATMAEFLKRLVMHREDAATRLPGIQWADLEVLFYGTAPRAHWTLPSESGVVPPSGWGGMSADAAITLQSAVDIRAVEAAAKGKWRIFSKLGYGDSGLVENSYGCFPVLDAAGEPAPGKGLELVVSTHFAQPRDNPPASRVFDAKVAAYTKLVVARLARLP